MVKNCCLIGPAKRFVISNKTVDASFGPGSTGLISYIKGSDKDFPNIVYVAASMTRRGKTGKERIESVELCTPLFDSDTEIPKEFYPEEKRKYFVHMESDNLKSNNVLDMSDISFLGWLNSVGMFLSKLMESSTKIKNVPPQYVDTISSIVGLPSRFQHDADETKSTFCAVESRLNFVNILRNIESQFSRSITRYRYRVFDMQISIANHLLENGVVTKEIEESLAQDIKIHERLSPLL